MKYFLDTEFHEYKKEVIDKKVTSYKEQWQSEDLPISLVDTIELISIGIVAEDGREYYAVCNEFDVEVAWNNEWLRKNVLFPIWFEDYNLINYKNKLEKGVKLQNYNPYEGEQPLEVISYEKGKLRVFNPNMDAETYIDDLTCYYILNDFNITSMKLKVKLLGKSKNQLANEILEFVKEDSPEFYAYYADYDWVVFCWLFGRMIDLPKGFPMYCIDLKQLIDEDWNSEELKKLTNYPKQENEHNALADAKWNKKLFNFLNQL